MSLPARGAAVRGALALMELLEGEGRTIGRQGGSLVIRPARGLDTALLRQASDLKPELMALAVFTPAQRRIIARHGSVDLGDLKRYAAGLECWLRFSPVEQAQLIGLEPAPEDLVNLAALKVAAGGEVAEAERDCPPEGAPTDGAHDAPAPNLGGLAPFSASAFRPRR